MKLISFAIGGEARYGAVEGETVIDSPPGLEGVSRASWH
ncbi:Rv2993c-like domain-containing protein [Belnapia arida]|nr:Rv2993c-like domain-containing protein [Belnapia arida]